MPTSFYDAMSSDEQDEEMKPQPLVRTKSWKEYEGNEEIPMILSEGYLPVRFQGSAFQELDYEGAVRFYFEDGTNELTKAVRLTNKTTVDDLIPILVEKFSLSIDQDYALFEIYDKGDFLLLELDECPLARAISKQKVPRFVLKSRDENGNAIYPVQVITLSPVVSGSKKDKRPRLFSFGNTQKDKKELDKGKKEETEKEKTEKKNKKNKESKKSKKHKDKSFIKITHIANTSPNLSDEREFDIEEPLQEIVQESNPEFSFDQLEDFEDSVDGPNFSDVSDDDLEHKIRGTFIPPRASPDGSAEDLHISVEEIANRVVVEEEEVAEVRKAEVHAELDENIFDIEENLANDENNNKKTRTLSFSNSSIFFDQDNDNSNNNIKDEFIKRRNKKKDEKKFRKSRKSEKQPHPDRKTKSISKMLKGQKKKDSPAVPATELSTNKLAPGILKVFGDHVSDGSLYKAVRVSTISTAQEVVGMALDRYGIENPNPKEYVLCDVVGQFGKLDEIRNSKKGKNTKKTGEKVAEEEQQWQTEYLRAINDYEKPLVLQSLWKPTNGRSRRFELRKRVDVENSCFFINTADGMGRRDSDASLFNDSERSSVHSNEVPNHTTESFAKTKKNTQEGRSDLGANQAPLYAPYLLLLHGNNNNKDQLIHKLDDPTNIVGLYMENESKQCNVPLFAPDILLPHCWLYKKVKLEDESTETNLDEINFLVFIEPASGADITVNGKEITTTTLIKAGQLITFGKQYLFLFKDPTQEKDLTLNLIHNMSDDISDESYDAYSTIPRRQESPKNEEEIYEMINEEKIAEVHATVEESVPEEPEVIETEIIETEEEEVEEISSADELEIPQANLKQENLAPRKKVEKSRLQISYGIKDEDEVLHAIIDIADEELGGFKLTPAYLFMMVIEHSAAKFTEIQTRKLLLKISSGLQGIAWEKTKEIGKQTSVKESNPMTILSRVLPELKPVLFWMASALEMLHYLQCNLNNYLLPREQVTTPKEALLSADEELLTVLEEVIMFTFQQTVYHLTKVLYAALPSIVSTNPYETVNDISGNRKEVNVHPDVANISIVFQEVLHAAKEHQVHPQIISQLFSYLFFFSNASLFNSLMEKGPGKEFYNWNKGVQIRGNLDVLEDWAQANGLRKQFEQYLNKVLCAVDLLSLPTTQLLQLDWRTLRQEYASLNPAQLQQLLGEYNLGGKQRPKGWYPPPEEVEPALRSSEVLESFATHPPLILPSGGFIIDLNKAPDSEEFFKYTTLLYQRFDPEQLTSPDGPVIPKLEPLKGDDGKAKPVKKARHQRGGSNINMVDVEAAITVKNEAQVESAPPSMDFDDAEPEIKSIHVSSQKSTQVKINSQPVTTVSINSKPKSILVNGNKNKSSEADNMSTLLSKARTLINADGESSGDEEISGYKNGGGEEDVFIVELVRSNKGLGLGLIDGMFTALKSNGIYIRTIVPNTPAAEDSRLRIGYQILAVNDTSLVGSDYNRAMDIIKKAGNKLKFLIAKSDNDTTGHILTTAG